MAYKDKEKQRTANRTRQRRKRDKRRDTLSTVTPFNVHDPMGSSDIGVVLALHKAIRRDLNPLGLVSEQMRYVTSFATFAERLLPGGEDYDGL